MVRYGDGARYGMVMNSHRVKTTSTTVSLGAINCFSAVLAKKIQVIFTVSKLVTVTIIITTGFVRLIQGGHNVALHFKFHFINIYY